MGNTRRTFLEGLLGAAALGRAAGTVPQRALGRTGEKVSIAGLGGFHIGNPRTQEESTRLVRTAIDGGITFMDNCWDYHDGGSEVRMGNALRDGYRQRVFLMSKIDGHSRDVAARQIDESLKRLETDHVDLMQFHEVIRPDDPDKIFARGGAFEAMLAAKKAGKVRFIGFTGHKSPDIHLKMIESGLKLGFTFDTVQMPLNLFDTHFNSFEHKVLPVLLKHRIGVLGMKPMGGGILLKSGAATPVEFLHYAMNLETDVVITGCQSTRDLEQALEAARSFKPLGGEEVAALRAKTAHAAANGQFEQYKTTTNFDGTVHNPQWLG